MGGGGAGADEQPGGDLRVGQTLAEQNQHLPLPPGQVEPGRGQPAGRIAALGRDGLLTLDRDLRVVSANDPFRVTFGVEETALAGRTLGEVSTLLDTPALTRRIQALIEGAPFEPLRLGSFEGDGEKDLLVTAVRFGQADATRIVLQLCDLSKAR